MSDDLPTRMFCTALNDAADIVIHIIIDNFLLYPRLKTVFFSLLQCPLIISAVKKIRFLV